MSASLTHDNTNGMTYRTGKPRRHVAHLVAIAGLALSASAVGAPNILVILADDMGTEVLSSYGLGSPTAVTPTLDRLASEGVRFERFWSQPTCTPSRAAALTGRYAHRTGVMAPLRHYWALLDSPVPEPPAHATTELYYSVLALEESGEAEVTQPPPPPLPDGRSRGLSTQELLLPQVLKSLPEPYATAAVGKWHLTDLVNGGVDHPNAVGFDYYSGSLFGLPASFFAWRHVENGRITAESGYIDRRVTQDAIRWIGEQGEAPWFLWLSFTNPHVPVHLPPRDLLHSEARDLEANFQGEERNQAYFLAQVEAMDTLIGQLLDSIPEEVLENTYVIFLSDNGTDKWVNPPAPRDPARVKITVYEGGINVPLIVTGPGISGGRVEQPLAHVVDLFATVLELAGADAAGVLPESLVIDSVSMAPYLFQADLPSRRSWVLSEGLMGGGAFGGTAIRDERYKLLVMPDREEFYDIEADPHELAPLSVETLSAAARSAYDRLKGQVDGFMPE